MINNGFIKKSIGTLTLGEKLKKIRSDRRLSLNEVSRNTKIQVKYLECLENEDYDKLPAQVYTRGFLRSYAEFLGADEQLLVRLYEKELGIRKNLEKSRHNSFQTPLSMLFPTALSFSKLRNKPVRISSFVITPRMLVALGMTGLVVAGMVYLYREFGSFANIPRLVITSPQANHLFNSNLVSVEGYTNRDARIFINDQPVLVNDEGKFREDLTIQSGTNILQIRAINRFEKETSQVITLESTYQEPEMEDATGDSEENSEAQNKNNVEVSIRVDPGPVWLSVESDGNLVFSGTMLTGAVQSFQAENKIMINSGKGNATFIKFNGKEIGTLGDGSGAVREVIFTKETKYE